MPQDTNNQDLNNQDERKNHNISFYNVSQQESGLRLDKWLLLKFDNINNSIAQKLIRTGQVRVNSKRYKFNQEITRGDIIRIPLFIIKNFSNNKDSIKEYKDINKYKKEIDNILKAVIYKDDDFIAINKPSGLAVQGGSKVGFNLSYAFEALALEKDSFPHIVHRIDKDTSGVLLMARHKEASQYLSQLFQNKEIKKTYICLAYTGNNKINSSGIINVSLEKQGSYNDQKMVVSSSGKEAISEYEVLNVNLDKKISLFKVHPRTGRTHQIRVHLSEVLNSPIMGDFKYGFRDRYIEDLIVNRLYLHSRSINFINQNGEKIEITADFDDNFIDTFKQLDFSNTL